MFPPLAPNLTHSIAPSDICWRVTRMTSPSFVTKLSRKAYLLCNLGIQLFCLKTKTNTQ
ncbi:hypothetical protein JRQ81_001526, partial [Phrynocephalus forsythii]